jgi:hypothetical protein
MASEVSREELSTNEYVIANTIVSSYRDSLTGHFISQYETPELNMKEILSFIDTLLIDCYGKIYARFNSLLLSNVIFKISHILSETNPMSFSTTDSFNKTLQEVVQKVIGLYKTDSITGTRCVNLTEGNIDVSFLVSIILMYLKKFDYNIKDISRKKIEGYVKKELDNFQDIKRTGGTRKKTRKQRKINKRKTKRKTLRKRSVRRRKSHLRRRKQ